MKVSTKASENKVDEACYILLEAYIPKANR
jgi:hypothetical protein